MAEYTISKIELPNGDICHLAGGGSTEGMVVGTYNYLINSRPTTNTTTTGENIWYHTNSSVAESLGNYMQITASSTSNIQIQRFDYYNGAHIGSFESSQFNEGDSFVVSCDIKSSSSLGLAFIWGARAASSGTLASVGNNDNPYSLTPTTWTRAWFVGTVSSALAAEFSTSGSRNGIYIQMTPSLSGQVIYLRNLSLTKGNVKTEWAINPKDYITIYDGGVS